jgi:hypothetical protein
MSRETVRLVLLILVICQLAICFVAMRRHYRKRQEAGFDWEDRELWVTRLFLLSGIIFLLGLVVSFFH